MCAVAALNDKSLLLEIKNADGLDAYTYLKECLTHILSSQKSTGFEEFEAISKSVKELHRKSKTPAHVRKNPIELSFSKTQHGLYLQSEEDKYEASGIDTDVEESLPNLADVFYRFETAGIGFNTVECVQLTLAIKALIKSQLIISARFWGKIFGLMQNYFVVETTLSEEENAEEDEEDENAYPEEDHDKNTDELYDEDDNLKDILPKSKWRPPAKVPKEPSGTGVNTKTYFVCHHPGLPWTKLPHVTPQQLTAARSICAYFTGNLDAPVACSPSFPGTEANYLRAQIARISASTQISPEGFFTSEHGEEEEEPEPEQLEDEEGGGQITINEDYEPLPMTQLASPKVEHWVHHVPYILPQGRVTWWNPSSSDFDETEQIPEEEEEEEEEGAGKAHPSLPERGLPILSRVSLDAPIFGQPAWSVKMSPIFVPENAVVLVSSNLWPGSHAVAWERKFENIYIGWGSKTTGTAFQPYLPPDVMSEYQDTPEVIEIIDPTPEDEAALRKVQNAEEERGGTDEDGVQSEGESDATREEA